MKYRFRHAQSQRLQAADVGILALRRWPAEGMGQAAIAVIALFLDEIAGAVDMTGRHAAPAGTADVGLFDPFCRERPPAGEIVRELRGGKGGGGHGVFVVSGSV